jgi:hypothetical protein
MPSAVLQGGAVSAPRNVAGFGQGHAEKAPPEQVQIFVPMPLNPQVTQQSTVHAAPVFARLVLQVGSGEGAHIAEPPAPVLLPPAPVVEVPPAPLPVVPPVPVLPPAPVVIGMVLVPLLPQP